MRKDGNKESKQSMGSRFKNRTIRTNRQPAWPTFRRQYSTKARIVSQTYLQNPISRSSDERHVVLAKHPHLLLLKKLFLQLPEASEQVYIRMANEVWRIRIPFPGACYGYFCQILVARRIGCSCRLWCAWTMEAS